MLALLTCIALAQAPATPVGRVVLAEGEVEVRLAGAASPAPLAAGATLGVGDAVRSGAGRARILLRNRSVVDLAPDSELLLQASDGEGPRSRVTLRAVLGRLWARVAGLDGDERLTVETETAVAGVRGTSLFVDVDSDQTAITVDDGVVEVRPLGGEPFALARRERARFAAGTWSLERDLPEAVLHQARGALAQRRQLGEGGHRRIAGLRARLAERRREAVERLGHEGGGEARAGERGERARGALRKAWSRRDRGLDIDPAAARRLRSFLLQLRFRDLTPLR